VVGAVVLLLTLGAGEERAAGRTGQGVTSPVGSSTESATGPASATPDGSATDVAGEAVAGEAAAGEDGREVSADPLEPRINKEIIGTDFALGDAGWTEDAAGTRAGASEAVAGTYTDGATDVAVTVAAFGTIAEQDAYSEQLAGDLEDDGAQLLSEGSVYPDSTGRHWAYMLADGETTTVVWRTDDGVVLTLSGDPEAVAEVYSGMLI